MLWQGNEQIHTFWQEISAKNMIRTYEKGLLCRFEILMKGNKETDLFFYLFQKCEGLMQPEFKKFSIDPQITSFEMLKNLLAKAFDIRRYKCLECFSFSKKTNKLGDYENYG